MRTPEREDARREAARREEGKPARSLTEISTAMDGNEEVTESEVREALSLEAEKVMNTTIPTPTQADTDKFVMGEIGLDDKEVHEVPNMPPLEVQQELLDQAVPDEPPVSELPGGPTEPPVNRDVPHVSGAGTVGSVLNCTMGNWDNEPSNYAYAWQTDGAPNTATGATYTIAAGDVGKEISCIVTASNVHGEVAAPESNAVSVGAAAREMTAGENNPGYQTRTIPKR